MAAAIVGATRAQLIRGIADATGIQGLTSVLTETGFGLKSKENLKPQ